MRLAVCLLSDMYSWLMPALSFADDGVWVNELILSALFRLESLMFTVAVGRGNATVLPLYASAGAYWLKLLVNEFFIFSYAKDISRTLFRWVSASSTIFVTYDDNFLMSPLRIGWYSVFLIRIVSPITFLILSWLFFEMPCSFGPMLPWVLCVSFDSSSSLTAWSKLGLNLGLLICYAFTTNSSIFFLCYADVYFVRGLVL